MIPAKKVARQIRLKLDDLNEVKYSSYDLLNALNEVLRYLNQNFSLANSDFLEHFKEYRQKKLNTEIDKYNESLSDGEEPKEHIDFARTGVELPDDFVSLVRVERAKDHYNLSPAPGGGKLHHGNYRVFAGRIFARHDFNLLYRGKINEVENVNEDSIELPDIFFDLLVKLTMVVLEQNPSNDVLMSEVNRLVDAIVPRRRYANVKIKMPFMV